MNRLTAGLASMALATTLLGTTPLHAEGNLALYNWGDYINPEILQQFEAETGIKVTLDTYASNEEMLAKIQAGATGYDIVFPSVHMQDIMVKLNLLDKTGINSHADFKNIDTSFLRSEQDPTSEYCLPYAWGSVGYFYDEKVTGPLTSWADFFGVPDRTGGKITLLDDMREVLAIGLIANGKSVNSTDPADIKEATDYILQQKPNITSFTYDVAALLPTGDIAAGQFFVGLNVITKPIEGLKYVIPSEGATLYQENMCVLATAPNRDNAIKFMEFYLKPEIAALNVKQQFNGTPNVPARELIPEEIKSDPNINVDAKTLENMQIFTDIGRAIKLYDRAWNTIRTAE